MTFTRERFNAPFENWTDYTPTTTFTEGNGTIVARYSRVGNTVRVFFEFTLGNTSSVPANPTVTLPPGLAAATATYTFPRNHVGQAYLFDTGGSPNARPGLVRLESTTTVSVSAIDASATYAANASVSSTVPFTWATGDIYQVQFSYETDFS